MSLQENTGGGKFGRPDIAWMFALCFLTGLLYLPQFFSGLSAIEAPHKMDIATQWYPGTTFWSSCYTEGLFPLWNPLRYGGMPWLSYIHGGMLYPPNVIFYTIFGFLNGVTLTHFLYTLLAALGCYLLFRELGMRRMTSFVAALVFSCSGFYFFLQSQLSNHATLPWLPFFLFGLIRVHRRPRAPAFMLLVIASAAMILGGDTEAVLSNLFFAVLFCGFYLYREFPGNSLRTLFLAGCAFTCGVMISSAQMLFTLEFFSHSIRSSNALFDLEFTGFFTNWHKYLPFMFFPFKHFSDIHPVSNFNTGLAPFYIGILPFAAVIFSLGLYRKDGRVKAFLQAALLMAVYIVIKEVDIFDPVVRRIPFIGQSATPERSVEQIELALLIAGAFAYERFLKDSSIKGFRILFGLLAAWGLLCLGLAPLLSGLDTRYLAGAAALFFGISGIAARMETADARRFAETSVLVILLCDVYLLGLASVPRTDLGLFDLDPTMEAFLDRQDKSYRFINFEKIGREAESAELSGLIQAKKNFSSAFGHMRLPLYRYYEFLHLINPGVAGDLDEMFFKEPGKRKLFFTIDMLNPDYLSNQSIPLLNLLAVKYIFSRKISFKYSSPFCLMNDGGLINGDWISRSSGRGHAEAFRRDSGRLAFDVELPWRVEFESHVYPDSVLCFDLKPGKGAALPWQADIEVLARTAQAEEMRLIADYDIEAWESEVQEFPVRIYLDDLAGELCSFRIEISSSSADARAVIIDARFERPDAPFQRVAPGPVDIFVNSHALPRCFILHEACLLGPAETRELMVDPLLYDPGSKIILEKGGAPESLAAWANEQPHPLRDTEYAAIRDHGSQKVDLNALAFSPGWLFLSDPYYPGWRAWVDGEESRIYRADYTFRAVFLSKGLHYVMFRYEPVSFRAGLWFGLASFAAALVAVIIIITRRGCNERKE